MSGTEGPVEREARLLADALAGLRAHTGEVPLRRSQERDAAEGDGVGWRTATDQGAASLRSLADALTLVADGLRVAAAAVEDLGSRRPGCGDDTVRQAHEQDDGEVVAPEDDDVSDGQERS